MQQSVTTVLTVLALLALVALLRSAAGRPAKYDPETGELVLKIGALLAWVMGAAALIPTLLLGSVVALVPSPPDVQERAIPFLIGIGAFFLITGGSIALWSMRRATRIGLTGMTSEYVFSKPRFLAWDDVVRVTYRRTECWIHGKDGDKALLHVWFVGIREVIPMLRYYLPVAVQQRYEVALRNFAAVVGVDDNLKGPPPPRATDYTTMPKFPGGRS